MKIISLKFTDNEVREIIYFLGRRYERDRRSGIPKLCKLAILHEIREQANKDVEEFNA